MYKCLIILVIFCLYSCHKQTRYTNNENENEIGIVFNTDNENTPRENITSNENTPEEDAIRPDFVTISNEENFPLENIIGAWWAGNPYSTIFIEFTNNGVFYIHELDNNDNLIVEDFFPYKIEENNIIIEDINKSNNADKKMNALLNLVFPSDLYIENLNDRSLDFERLSLISLDRNARWRSGYSYPLLFYRGTMEEILERNNINLYYRNKLKGFIANEMLDGIVFQGDENDENGVIDTYGVPIKDEIVEYSGTPRYFREITYGELTHRYYVLNNNEQRYADVILDKKLDRLTTINIGAASDEVTAVFGNYLQRKEGEDIIYTLSDDHSPDPLRWVRFSIENGIVVKITYIISGWGK